MIGKVFDHLSVVERLEDYVTPTGGKHKRYLCKCSCGKETAVLKEYLTSGRQKSCGCQRGREITHGHTSTRIYRIWANMVNRCTNPNNPAYHNYGGRGITVCDEWRKFEPFLAWAESSGYSDQLTIDRIDNESGYYPENCRWVNDFTQANNKRSNRFVEYGGQSMTLADWSRAVGIPYKTLHRRLVASGWDVERALTQKLRKGKSTVCQTQN